MVVSHYPRTEYCKKVLEATGTNSVYQDESRLSVYMSVQVMLKSTRKPPNHQQNP